MIRYPNLIPECNVDTVFVESLGFRGPNHAPDIHQVYTILENKRPTLRAIGFVDGDKKPPRYHLNFGVVENLGDIRLFKHHTKPHYLAIVYPAMDGFIYNLCADLNIDLPHYHLPAAFDAFLRLTKRIAIIKNSDFRNVLNRIQHGNSAKIARIRDWIQLYGTDTAAK
jgi:hypothetical protein